MSARKIEPHRSFGLQSFGDRKFSESLTSGSAPLEFGEEKVKLVDIPVFNNFSDPLNHSRIAVRHKK